MRGIRRSICSIILFGLCMAPAATAQPPADGQPEFPETDAVPLFASHDVLEFTIEGPLDSVFRERSQDSQSYRAVISYEDSLGARVSVRMKLSTRGKRRLDRRVCRFPPLRVDLPKSKVAGTVFAGQNKLKLVTHCQDGRTEYEQYVLQEYLVYRTFNLVTDLSFRVRLARITYVDTEEDREPLTRYAFFIEPKRMMAARNGWEALDAPGVAPEYFERLPLGTVEVFQYMIGNTDWSAFEARESEDECCHNTEPVGSRAGPVFSVPYDFDQAGMIHTRYARPDERLRLRNVRQRLYRGLCRPWQELEHTLQVFREKRDAIYALYRTQHDLDSKRLERMLEYLDDFYEVINDEKEVADELVDNCRPYRG